MKVCSMFSQILQLFPRLEQPFRILPWWCVVRPATVAGGRRVRRVPVGGGHFRADLGVPNRGVRMRRAGDE